MRYDPFEHDRRSVRLAGRDYSSGSYFITICVADRECLFGQVEHGSVVLNDFGKIAEQEWLRSGSIRVELEIDSYVVMPNHLHGIVHLMGTSPVGARGARPDGRLRLPRQSVGAFVAGFKAAVTRRINAARDTEGALVWQRNYHEHVIRDERELQRIRQYIVDNPRHWQEDEYFK